MTTRFTVALVAILSAHSTSFPAPVSAGVAAWGLSAGWSAAQLDGDGGNVIAPDSGYTYGPLDMVPGGEFEFHNHVLALTAGIEAR